MSPRTLFTRWASVLAATTLVTACVGGLFDARKGKVDITVKWPRSAYATLAIPEGTARIDVAIQGEGLETAPMKASLTPKVGAETSTDFVEVPIGPKVVQATAYDAEGHATAFGQDIISVQPNAITEAHIDLKPGAPSPEPGQSPSPNPNGTPGADGTIDFTITTGAGDGQIGAVDASSALSARFHYPASLAFDPSTRAIYIADSDNHLIRKLDLATNGLSTIAGQAPVASAAPTAAPALLGPSIGTPAGLAIGPGGVLYFADPDNHMVRRIGPDGSVLVVAGNGRPGAPREGQDALTASFQVPIGLAFDSAGALYVADQGNQKVYRIVGGAVSTFAGTGQAGSGGDGGLATDAQLDGPNAVAVAPQGKSLFIAEAHGRRVRMVGFDNKIILGYAGTGALGTGTAADGEGGLALRAALSLPRALAFDADGGLLIADGWAARTAAETTLGSVSRVLKVTPDGKLIRLAGTGANGFGGDGDDARKAVLNNPAGVAVDDRGRIFVADSYNNRLRVLVPVPKPSPSSSAAPAATPSPEASASATPGASPTGAASAPPASPTPGAEASAGAI